MKYFQTKGDCKWAFNDASLAAVAAAVRRADAGRALNAEDSEVSDVEPEEDDLDQDPTLQPAT